MKKRSLEPYIQPILDKKMVFLGGPRQSGKTTFAKYFLENDQAYLNWDFDLDRERILTNKIPLQFPILVLDEIHKYSRWRNWLKGYYDKYHEKNAFLVTGSARLDLYRRGGDSLQGRYRYLRLYPFTFNEVKGNGHSDLMHLLKFSGFPEPFLSGSENESRIWSRDYRSRVIRDDIVDLEKVNEMSLLEKLYLFLPSRVGSPLSINSLREDIQVSFETVKRWIEILERVYVIFRVYPLQNKKLSSLKKESKHYHYDWTVVDDEAARFENLVGFHLLRHVHFLQDTEGQDIDLFYFRDLEKREVDFVITEQNKPKLLVEVKTNELNPTEHLKYLKNKFPDAVAVQVVLKKDIYEMRKDILVCSAPRFFKEFLK